MSKLNAMLIKLIDKMASARKNIKQKSVLSTHGKRGPSFTEIDWTLGTI